MIWCTHITLSIFSRQQLVFRSYQQIHTKVKISYAHMTDISVQTLVRRVLLFKMLLLILIDEVAYTEWSGKGYSYSFRIDPLVL